MVDCTSKSDGKKEILPLFFDVKPDDVKLRTELYSNDLSKHEKNHCPGVVKRWKAALREVATRVGWTGQGKEYGELLKLIVREVLLKLKVKNRHLPNNLVEMDNEEDIEELLKVDSDDHVRFVIIYGTGGIGKTTLASIIFNRFQSKFDYSSFLEELSHRHGLLHVQKKLLFDTLGSPSDRISDINDGINQLKRGLKEKKVLVVLDNVNDKNQLETLAGSHKWFTRGIRIIVTVRDRRTILDRIIIDEDEQKRHVRYIEYPVKLMPLDRSIQLFSKHAFRSNTPPKDWLNFSKDVILSIGRLPLTLEVVGSLFAGTDRSKWDETLKDLKQVPCQEVREALMISFNKLGRHNQEIFLDIACFCIGEDKMHAYYMWTDCGYCPHRAIEDLLLMSLIKIDEDNTFWMHNEVRDLGRYIVKEVSFEDAGKRRWVEIGENTLDILSSIEEKGDVRALTLGITHDLTPEELACLPKLRFLGGQTLNFVGDFKNLLKKLQWLSWHHFLPNFSATNLHLVNLVVLNLSRSNITHDWNGWRQIEMAKRLKFLDLTECYNLTRTPDFSEFGKLEKLIFARCCQLSTIDSSISKLKRLSTLNIQGCASLEGLPEEIGSTQCLSEIIMPHFGKLFKLPDTLGNLKSLTKFEVIGHYGISQIPHSIGRLNLTHLVLSSCNNLHELPDSIGELELLIKLDLRFSGISVLPESIGKLKNLEHLLLHHCENLHKLPDSIGELESLIELDLSFSRISVLPSIERLKNLKYLLLSCINLHKLPDSIGELESLVELDLELSGISVLPNSLGRLKNLRHLFFFACMNLHKLPDSIGELELLINLDLEFSRISIAPNSIGGLTNLMQLSFSRCENLHELRTLLENYKHWSS
ncbi:disease resistance protein RPV1-like [Eucalyptus grandis]|uniref:disease resistance protein RPV1-like n=1 Tax=Eucalyptus grandis TaxID=71139 RepID=UPI00192E7903|nr:disease resistance protein RPV1-like [Eucalyptus grandis]